MFRSGYAVVSSAVVLSAVALLAACVDPVDPTPEEVSLTDAMLAELLPAVGAGRDFYLMPVTITRTAGPQTVQIPLAAKPWSSFMGPFYLFIVKETGPLRGSVAFDGVVRLQLGPRAVADTVRRKVDVQPGSMVEVVLTGTGTGSVTLWIVGRLQPRPTITIDTPLRAAMLDTGNFNVWSIPLRGRACHPHFPITSLRVHAVALPVSGTSLCESFDVTHTSQFGMGLISIEATNAHGRTTRQVQSYLRSPIWLFADVENGATTTVVNGLGIAFNPGAMDDFNRSDPDDFATLVQTATRPPNVDAFLPVVLVDEEPVQPNCRLGFPAITRRGYRVDRGATSYGDMVTTLSPVAAGAQLTMEFRNVRVPIVVHGYVKTSCLAPREGITNGELLFDRVFAILPISISLAAGNQLAVAPVSPTTGTGIIALNITYTKLSLMTAAQQQAVVDFVVPFTGSRLRDGAELTGRDGVNRLGDLLRGMAPTPGPGLDALGLNVTSPLSFVSATSTRLFLGWYPRLTVDRVRSGAPPARGPIYYAGVPSLPPTSVATGIGTLSMDVMNALLWGAWRGGKFDRRDLLTHPDAPPVEGLALRARSVLPPVVQWGVVSNQFRLAWGDLRLDATVDPSVFGDEPAGSPMVSGRVFASMYIDVIFSYDPLTRALDFQIVPLHSTVQLQMPSFGTTWIDDALLEEAIRSTLWAVAPVLYRRVLGNLPLPAASAFSIPSLAPLSALRLNPATTARSVNHLLLSGGFVAE